MIVGQAKPAHVTVEAAEAAVEEAI